MDFHKIENAIGAFLVAFFSVATTVVILSLSMVLLIGMVLMDHFGLALIDSILVFASCCGLAAGFRFGWLAYKE